MWRAGFQTVPGTLCVQRPPGGPGEAPGVERSQLRLLQQRANNGWQRQQMLTAPSSGGWEGQGLEECLLQVCLLPAISSTSQRQNSGLSLLFFTCRKGKH